MKSVLVSLVLLLSFCDLSFAHTHRNTKHALDPSYCLALATANRFLHAWQSEDHETGIVMLTDSAREHSSPEQLQSFFSPGPNAAYEIAHGKRTKSGGYAFPVVLFNNPVSWRRHNAKVIVTRDGKNDWAVDKLP